MKRIRLPLALAAAISAVPAARAEERLWDEWYLITQKGAAAGYFEETAEKRPKEQEIAITQKWVEKAEGRQETYIGSVSNSVDLTPVAFFVERKGSKSYKIDGRAKGQNLEITFKPGSPDLARSTEITPLGAGYYLSSFLGPAISRKFKGGKGAFAFTAVLEDDGDMNVVLRKGTVELGTHEKKIGKRLCRGAIVTLEGKVQEWWVHKSGLTCQIVFPDSGTKMDITTEKEAKKALKEL